MAHRNTADDITDHVIDLALGLVEPSVDEIEHRSNRRADFDGSVAIVQMTPGGGKSIPSVVRCKNVSPSGMCVVSRYMLHVGHEGAVLMQRSNGEKVLLGVKDVHCRYVGDMDHESGVRFIDVPKHFSIEDFKNDDGELPDFGAKSRAA